MKKVKVRLPDEIWFGLIERAKKEGKTVDELFTELIENGLNKRPSSK